MMQEAFCFCMRVVTRVMLNLFQYRFRGLILLSSLLS